MKVRALFSFAVAVGLSGAAVANPPAPLSASASNPSANPNQKVADDVAYRLRSTGSASGADVSIVAQEGIVTLAGSAKDAAQKARIAADVKAVTGVVIVRDNVRAGASGVVQVQDPPINLSPIIPPPLGPDGLPQQPLPVAPPVAGGFNPIVEPMPLGVPGQASPDMQAPNLPPYAWPTYAPHNNLSRVAYPQAYPYNAFPFIGPFYPFPKVPLGWRKVSLEWDDGHWYLGRQSAPHDYWRVKFW